MQPPHGLLYYQKRHDRRHEDGTHWKPRRKKHAINVYMPPEICLWGCSSVIFWSNRWPTQKWRWYHLKKITSFTIVSSLQLSIVYFKNTPNFYPTDHKLNIFEINTNLCNIFILVMTRNHLIIDSNQNQQTIKVYNKILQPEEWA